MHFNAPALWDCVPYLLPGSSPASYLPACWCPCLPVASPFFWPPVASLSLMEWAAVVSCLRQVVSVMEQLVEPLPATRRDLLEASDPTTFPTHAVTLAADVHEWSWAFVGDCVSPKVVVDLLPPSPCDSPSDSWDGEGPPRDVDVAPAVWEALGLGRGTSPLSFAAPRASPPDPSRRLGGHGCTCECRHGWEEATGGEQ